MHKHLKILFFFIASLVIPVIGEAKALRAEKLLATIEEKAAYKNDFVRLSNELKGKNVDEAIEILSKEKNIDEIISSINKVDNIIDDVGNASLLEKQVTDEIVATNNSISDIAKKFWANHEVNVTKYLRGKYGNANVGRQITVDITLKDGSSFTCRLDNLVKDGNQFKIFDAKSSVSKDLSKTTAEDLATKWSTENQNKFYNALKKGEVESIKPRGQRALDFFNVKTNNLLNPINVENNIEFLVNDVATDGYKMYSKKLNF